MTRPAIDPNRHIFQEWWEDWRLRSLGKNKPTGQGHALLSKGSLGCGKQLERSPKRSGLTTNMREDSRAFDFGAGGEGLVGELHGKTTLHYLGEAIIVMAAIYLAVRLVPKRR